MSIQLAESVREQSPLPGEVYGASVCFHRDYPEERRERERQRLRDKVAAEVFRAIGCDRYVTVRMRESEEIVRGYIPQEPNVQYRVTVDLRLVREIDQQMIYSPPTLLEDIHEFAMTPWHRIKRRIAGLFK